MPLINAKINKGKGFVDGLLSFAMWLAWATVAVIFIASVAKTVGVSPRWIPVPTAEYLQLLYAAGVVYLLRR